MSASSTLVKMFRVARRMSAMEFLHSHKQVMVDQSDALPGRTQPVVVAARHFVLDSPMSPPVVPPLGVAIFGLGCFWGAERLFWQVPGVVTTAVGYAGGFTENSSYEEVCTGKTGHAEVVRVVYDATRVGYEELLRVFFEGHDPTQFMRQGNDVGTQYRSVIYTSGKEQDQVARSVTDAFSKRLREVGFGRVVTEIVAVDSLATSEPFFFAEDYHQQYLAKNPNGYCGLGGTGVSCPVGLLG